MVPETGEPIMAEKATVCISTDPAFLQELSEYLEVLSNPVRLKILKVIEREPKEISEIASKIETARCVDPLPEEDKQ